MNKGLLVWLAVLALSGCGEEEAGLPGPVEMTAEAVGYYCQMDVLEHDGPKGQVQLKGLPGALFFSQVRDAIAYLHMPEQSHEVAVAFVQDMSHGATWTQPGRWIAVDSAFYVLGSSLMGGMGAPEFVPFSDKAAAVAFAAEHGGHIRRFDEIEASDVLVEPAEPDDAADDDDIADRLTKLSVGDEG